MSSRRFAKRRDPERNHAQAKIQISAETSRGNFVAQFAISRRDYPDVHLAGFRRTDPQHLTVLEHAQQLGLEVRARLADLVEKQRAARGALEASCAVADSPG